MSASLLVLAAGLGTRFKGGIKQLRPVGPGGELLMEYSVYDALGAGFDKVIFIVREDIEQQLREQVGKRIEGRVRTEYCIQKMEDLPAGFGDIKQREKPWGTVHAVLAARDVIDEPFLIVNADDYYGRDVYSEIYGFLTSAERRSGEHCMGGFVLKNTISDVGTVTRGVCSDTDGMLTSVTETYKVSRDKNGVISGRRDELPVILDENSTVSMNMWGFGKEIVPELKKGFALFLEKARTSGTAGTAEYALPMAVDELIKTDRASVRLLPTNDKWYGMTQSEDCPEIEGAFSEMVSKGIYPSPLF